MNSKKILFVALLSLFSFFSFHVKEVNAAGEINGCMYNINANVTIILTPAISVGDIQQSASIKNGKFDNVSFDQLANYLSTKITVNQQTGQVTACSDFEYKTGSNVNDIILLAYEKPGIYAKKGQIVNERKLNDGNGTVVKSNFCTYTQGNNSLKLTPKINVGDVKQSEKITGGNYVPVGASQSVTEMTKIDSKTGEIKGCPAICATSKGSTIQFDYKMSAVINCPSGTSELLGTKYNGWGATNPIPEPEEEEEEAPVSCDPNTDAEIENFFNGDPVDVSCNGIFTPQAIKIIKEVLNYFRILGPIALIVLIAADFAIAASSHDEKAMKKATGKVLKRSLATIGLFLVPTLIIVLLNMDAIKNTLMISDDPFCFNATGTEKENTEGNYWDNSEYKPSKPVSYYRCDYEVLLSKATDLYLQLKYDKKLNVVEMKPPGKYYPSNTQSALTDDLAKYIKNGNFCQCPTVYYAYDDNRHLIFSFDKKNKPTGISEGTARGTLRAVY